MTIAIDQFPPAIAPHAKRNEHFHGNGTTHPFVGGWVIDGRAVSYDKEAHAWLKANGFTHHGRRWFRADDVATS